MVKSSRRKIIITLAITFGASIAAIIALIFMAYRQDNRNDISGLITNHFRVLVESIDGDVEETDNSQNMEKPKDKVVTNDDYSIDRQRESIYSIRTIQNVENAENGDFEVYERANSGSLTDEEILAIGEEIFALSSMTGTWKNYYYGSTLVNGYLTISFVDISETIKTERNILVNFIVIGFIIWIVLVCVSIPISGVLVKPLEDAIRRQSEFIRMAEHELKTPLSVMQTSLTMMEKDGIKSKYLDYAKNENDKMKKLVAEMLELSRAEQLEKRNPVFVVINLSECVEGAVLPFEALAYEKGVKLETSIEESIFMPADSVQIDRLVGILLDNAIKHTEKEGVIKIKLSRSVNSGKIRLSVENQGAPIPSDEKDKIFEPFYRIDKGRNRDEGRYGLGLTIAKSVCAAHNGNLSLSYEDGFNNFYVIFS